MTGVEVLAPVRLETRFVPPELRDDGVDQWMLRLRIYPDEFSMARRVASPAPAELDRLAEAVAAMAADPPLDEPAAFARFAAAVGAGRALGLWRRCVVTDGAGGLSVDRSQEEPGTPFTAHGPAGLPEHLEVWLVHADGTRELAAALTLDLAGIGADLDLAVFDDRARLAAGTLPDTWWLSYPRAVAVGLGVDLDVGATPPALDALVVLGVGETDAADLVEAHSAGARLAVLPPGTPTNTVAGEPTTDFGVRAESVYPLLHADTAAQPAGATALVALTGRVGPGALPMLGGDLDLYQAGALAVQGLWPVLWGRSFRDVAGAGPHEPDVARWAIRNLSVEGLPAVRVGEQPYGLLPTTAYAGWTPEPGDELAPVEERILRWALPWRAGAAAAARAADLRVHGADDTGLLRALGAHAPSRHWRIRPVADLHVLQALRALLGMPPQPASDWDRETAAAWRDVPYPLAPIGAASRGGPVPGPPGDAVDDVERLRALCTMAPEPLYFEGAGPLGLVGHLLREALVDARASVGEAIGQLAASGRVVPGRALPLDDEPTYRGFVLRGTDGAVAALDGSGDPGARAVAGRFHDVQEALEVLADLWAVIPGPLFRAVLAALDTAAFRVDPWLTGLAARRLQRMTAAASPFKLGAYGWVDAPAPFGAGSPAALAPGPTAAGLLHAPSPAQALTAALLRDAAVRHPDDDRWQLTVDSAKVRASVAFAERVRLGVHPYEALGLEVERLAGDWDTVRRLRQAYPLAPGQQERRVCDGAAVLRAAREATLVAGLPADLAARVAPLDDVLDTYADLLLADGIHALVTGRADLGNAAMEAGAGLGAPPDLRSIRTPRGAGTVRVAAWLALPPGAAPPAGADADPAAVADPAFVALLDAQGVPRGDDALPDRQRVATVLGGGEDEAPAPSLTGGTYPGLPESADADLRAAVLLDLDARLGRLRLLAASARDDLIALDAAAPDAPVLIAAAAARWQADLTAVPPADHTLDTPTTDDLRAALVADLDARLSAAMAPALPPVSAGGAAAPVPDAAVNARRRALRLLAGRAELPVLPVVDAALLPALRPLAGAGPDWLEIVAAVHPRLAPLEARQFDPLLTAWPAALAAPDGSDDPWHSAGPVLVVHGPGAAEPLAGPVAIAALDAWTDSVPSRRHVTTAAFGFNAPKARAPQAILLAVPPDPSQRLTAGTLLDVVLETRELVHARAARPTDRAGLPHATPAPLVHADPKSLDFLARWGA